jgi:hypothetical protein
MNPEDLIRTTEWTDELVPEEGEDCIFTPNLSPDPMNPEERDAEMEIDINLGKAVDISSDTQTVITKKDGGVVAQKVVTLMQKGMSIEEASKTVGLDSAMLPRQLVNSITLAAIQTYQLPAAVSRELVRAGRNKILIEEGFSKDGDKKLALEAMKQISSDPDVGLNAPPAPIVQINMGDLKKVIDTAGVVNEEDLFRDD